MTHPFTYGVTLPGHRPSVLTNDPRMVFKILCRVLCNGHSEARVIATGTFIDQTAFMGEPEIDVTDAILEQAISEGWKEMAPA